MGIDLLRIVSMILIAMLHVLGQGGILGNAPKLSGNYNIAWLLESIAYPSVAAFGIIMGYVGYKREHKPSGFIYVWLQVVFYTTIITLLFMGLKPQAVNGSMIKYMLTPVLSEQYWYITAYLGLFLFMDGINLVVLEAPRVKLKIMIIASVMLFSILPIFADTDAFALRYGCSIICVGCFYFYGAYIKKYNCFEEYTNLNLILICALGIVVNFGSKLFIEVFLASASANPDIGNVLFNYNAPTVMLSASMLVVLFSRIKLKGVVAKIVKAVTPMTLGVYLINTHPLIFKYIMEDRYASFAEGSLIKLIIGTVLSALLIYFAGIAIDGIRFIIFEILHLKAHLVAVENYILKKCDR